MTTETVTADRDALLPCPWCGQNLERVSVSEGSTFRWRKVDGCCTDGPEIRHDTMAKDQAAAEVESRREAIEAWNTRADQHSQPASEPCEIADDLRMFASQIAEASAGQGSPPHPWRLTDWLSRYETWYAEVKS